MSTSMKPIPRMSNCSMKPLSAAQKLPPLFDAYIELHERIYNPGDTISGKLHMELRKKLCCEILIVKLYGSVRVFFTETTASKKPGTMTQNKAYEQEIVLVNKELALWTAPATDVKRPEVTIDEIARMARSTSIRPTLPKADAFPGLDSGVHDFDFVFTLPKTGLFTSFEAKNAAGCVRYFIQVQAIRNGMSQFSKKHLFPVVVPVNLDQELGTSEPLNVTETCSFAKGTVSATISLKKRAFLPGEPILGTIEIQNNSKESVKTAFLRIVQETDALSKRPVVEIKSTRFETSGTGLPTHKIVAGQTFTYPINFYVPALVPNFEIPDCLLVNYFLQLTIGTNRNCLCKGILTVKTKIVIGTHFSSDSSVLPAPPAYDDLFGSAKVQLPSYSAAIGGKSDINDEDDDFTDYSPLLYQYNVDKQNGSSN